jgi:hypothetical protein
MTRLWGWVVLRMADQKGAGRMPDFSETLARGEHVYPHRCKALTNRTHFVLFVTM